MSWIGWIILGALSGMVAKAIMKEEGGLLKNIILGIIGAVVGGGIVQMLGGSDVNGFNIYSFVVAVLGAMFVIYIVRLFTAKK
jgi:uncharacterized membrane protein YeaQ/YmgE (transglycosylase-associated protein family)